MNEVLAAVYRRDEFSLVTLLQDHRYKDRDKLDETLKVVLCDEDELQYHEKLHFAEMLLCAGASPNILNWNNQPMLAWAVSKGDVGIFHMLMNFAPNVDAYDDEFRYVMHYAAECGQTDMVGHLLAAGANPNVQDEFGNVPLTLCYDHEDSELLDMLLLDADVNLANYDKETPLHLAVCQDYPHAVDQLLMRNANIDAQDIHGDTALMIAAFQSKLSTVKLLVDGGSDVNLKNLNGNTAFHKACAVSGRDNTDIVRYLIKSNAKINMRNLSGNTPLFLAVEADNNATIRELILENSNVDLRGNAMFGRVSTPLELTMMHDNLVGMAMLLLAGCKFKKFQVDKAIAHLQLSRMSAGDEPKQHETKFIKLIDFINYLTTVPTSLSLLCRQQLRQSLGNNIKNKVKKLTLPPKIQDYLTITELDQMISLE